MGVFQVFKILQMIKIAQSITTVCQCRVFLGNWTKMRNDWLNWLTHFMPLVSFYTGLILYFFSFIQLFNSFMTEVLIIQKQLIDLLCKPVDWFLRDRDFHHERVKTTYFFNAYLLIYLLKLMNANKIRPKKQTKILIQNKILSPRYLWWKKNNLNTMNQ